MKQFTLMLGLTYVAEITDVVDLNNGAVFRYRGKFTPLPEFEKWEPIFQQMWASNQANDALRQLEQTPMYLKDEAEGVWLFLAARHPKTGSGIPFNRPDKNEEVQITLKPLDAQDSLTFLENVRTFYQKG